MSVSDTGVQVEGVWSEGACLVVVEGLDGGHEGGVDERVRQVLLPPPRRAREQGGAEDREGRVHPERLPVVVDEAGVVRGGVPA
eukprot:2444581-Rhodomonas_salina.1